ncbi:MAG: 30S ribosomal protein S5 [bacterium]|nr:30S ribosomal protein S5 [bacterium]
MNLDNLRNQSEYFEKVVQVNRVSKKTKGGDKRSLSVLVVSGDKRGRVGVGLGKASDVQSAVRKATTYAQRHMITVPLKDNHTIPHAIVLKHGAARVMLKPAPVGTGIIAGGAVRVVVEAAGISDIVSKILGTNNRASNVYATLEALSRLKKINHEAEKPTEKEENKSKKKEKKDEAA